MWAILLVLCLLFTACSESQKPTVLRVIDTEIEVNGKKANVYAIEQPDGMQGLKAKKGDWFDVIVENHIAKPTGIHWHGLILPNNQDGVPFITQPPIPPGGNYPYKFRLVQSGTFWMHSHYGLQEQQLLTAPLILYEIPNPEEQEVILFLNDFSFTSPREILKCLQSQGSAQGMSMKGMAMDKPDLHDVNYDAFLTNRKTLSNPEVVEVKPGKKVRLRIINGSSATNYFIDLGSLQGEAIAVDGNRIHPFWGSLFELAAAQRIDLLVTLAGKNEVCPILAKGEGTEMQTGLILKTGRGPIPAFPQRTGKQCGGFTNAQEMILRAKDPLPIKPIDRSLAVALGGNMNTYVWTINGAAWPKGTPLKVKEGERVELVFTNETMMSHPMHLHGHTFQVTEINGKAFSGAMRDTVLVMPHATVKVQFDAENPGIWPLHCHILYHMVTGMFTTLNYEGYPIPSFAKNPQAEIDE